MNTVKKIKTKGKRKMKYPGISNDADALGVTRYHLWCVLEGKRISASLIRSYKALKAEQKGDK